MILMYGVVVTSSLTAGVVADCLSGGGTKCPLFIVDNSGVVSEVGEIVHRDLAQPQRR